MDMKESMYCLQSVKVGKEYWKYVDDETIEFKKNYSKNERI